jgi:hypothetical protein
MFGMYGGSLLTEGEQQGDNKKDKMPEFQQPQHVPLDKEELQKHLIGPLDNIPRFKIVIHYRCL